MFKVPPRSNYLSAVLGTCFITGLIAGTADAVSTANTSPQNQAAATETTKLLGRADQTTSTPGVSPSRRIERDGQRRRDTSPDRAIRSIDGSDNNIADPLIGASHTALRRLVPSAYSDGVAEASGSGRLSARDISNRVAAQSEDRTNSRNATDYLWQWGQFLDHDIDLSDGTEPPEPLPISVPTGDIHFDPAGTGLAEIALNRTLYDQNTGVAANAPRQQINEISSWIDGSMVYGSDAVRAAALRTLDGTGQLKTSAGGMLPFNTEELPNAGGASPTLFLAGDVRANEQLALTSMHTLFVREHNRIAIRLATANPSLTGEEIYQRARAQVAGLVQAITYNQFLPLLLGNDALPSYGGYQSEDAKGVSNLFSTASYRFGHSALSETLLRLDADGNTIAAGDLPLRDAFFNPTRLIDEGGIEPVLRGLAAQRCQNVDVFVVDSLRNFLFGPPGSGGFDLVSLNIQRGRDHGLPSYNEVRIALGLPPRLDFAEISSDPIVQARLADAYGNTSDIDVWVGGLAEDHVEGAMVGELIATVLTEQFLALRDGDRFWFERSLPRELAAELNDTTLADVIRRNTTIGQELPDNVFVVRNGDRDSNRSRQQRSSDSRNPTGRRGR